MEHLETFNICIMGRPRMRERGRKNIWRNNYQKLPKSDENY